MTASNISQMSLSAVCPQTEAHARPALHRLVDPLDHRSDVGAVRDPSEGIESRLNAIKPVSCGCRFSGPSA